MNIVKVLQQKRFLVIFLFLSLLFTVFYFLVTGTYVVSLYQFNASLEPLRLVLTILISILTALAITLMFYKREQPLVCSQNAPAFLGSVLGLFTTSCPICFPLLLSIIGVGGSFALTVSQNAVPIQIASIVLLFLSIWLTTKK